MANHDSRFPVRAAGLLLAAALVAPLTAHAGGVLWVDGVTRPLAVAAGESFEATVRFRVVEPVLDGMRASIRLEPVEGGESYGSDPVASGLNAESPRDATASSSFAIAVPAEAAPGLYRVVIQHYTRVDDRWVRSQLVRADGDLFGHIAGEVRIVEPPPPPAAPPPLRRLEPGEVALTFECEDFAGMDGHGEDLATAEGWTWYSRDNLSGRRAAANTNGEGTIYTAVDPPLPAKTYRVSVNTTTAGSTVRVRLGDAEAVVDLLRTGWNPAVELAPTAPASRLAVEVVNRAGRYVILDSIHVSNIEDAVATSGLDPARQYLPADARPAKTARTVWTPSYMAGVRERIARYDHVREAADGIIARARELAAHPDEELFWNILGPTDIARVKWVNEGAPCPNCGHRGDRYVWEVVDPFEHPFKVMCPECEMHFPSNDFAAGEMTGGEYPDDGAGYTDGDETYHFIGYYIHWAYRSHYRRHLGTLAHAVALTDDPELAHKLGVMLIRAAQQYPNSEDRHQRSYYGVRSDASGLRNSPRPGYRSGAITDHIWASYDGRVYGQAYDALWPFIDDNEPLLELARRELPGVQTGEDLRLYIEENLLRRIGQMYCDGGIEGNLGYHHAGIAWFLLSLGDLESGRFPDAMDMLEFLQHRITGPLETFPERLMRDGSSHESTGYNTSRLNMVEALDVLERFFSEQGEGIARDRFPSIWDDPRFAAQFDYYTDYILLDRWLPTVGNVGGGTRTLVPERTAADRLSAVSPTVALRAWRQYRTPQLARLAYGWNDEAPRASLWEDWPLDELAEAREQAPPDVVERRTHLQDAYGLAFLRSGSGENARDVSVWYGALISHGHDDQLFWELTGKGLCLLPDLGYPRSWEKAYRWEAHSLTHNTLTVEGPWLYPPRGNGMWTSRKARGWANLLGTVSTAAAPPPLQIVVVEGGEYASDVNIAHRMLALVDLDEENFYVIDLFDVRGGTSHTLSYHGPQAEVMTGGVELTSQQGGTVAGEDVEYGEPVVGADGEETHSPFAHMVDVERGRPTDQFFVDYGLGDEQSTHLRLTFFPEQDTALALGTGIPPVPPQDYELRYCLQMREGPDPLAGRYVTVVEPYSTDRKVTEISRPAAGGVGGVEALRIATEDGDDTLLLSPDAGATWIEGDVSFAGRAALIRTSAGTVSMIVAYGFSMLEAPGVSLRADAPYIEGIISTCDYDDWSVVVPGIPAADALIGQTARVFNDLRSTMHVITAVEALADGTRLTLGTSALVHRGIATAIGNYTFRNAAPSAWALESFMAGTRLYNEAGDASWLVRSASGGWHNAPTGTRIDLLRGDTRFPASAEVLRSKLKDATGDGAAAFTIYEYGPGDRVEIVNFAWLTRAEDGTWAVVQAPGVEISLP